MGYCEWIIARDRLVSEMTYYCMSNGTSNSIQSLTHAQPISEVPEHCKVQRGVFNVLKWNHSHSYTSMHFFRRRQRHKQAQYKFTAQCTIITNVVQPPFCSSSFLSSPVTIIRVGHFLFVFPSDLPMRDLSLPSLSLLSLTRRLQHRLQ